MDIETPCYRLRKSSLFTIINTCMASNMNSQCSIACKLLSTIWADLLFFSCVSLYGEGRDKSDCSALNNEVKYGIFHCIDMDCYYLYYVFYHHTRQTI